MNGEATSETSSNGLDDTVRLGAAVGARLTGGETIELVGDLGTGKTVFVRGLAKGIDSRDQVQSPSFTISRVYRGTVQHTQSGAAQGADENRSEAVQSGTVSEDRKLERSDVPESRSGVDGSADKQASAVSELEIYHFDFHRLDEPGLLKDTLAETVEDPKAVVVVEWSDIVKEVLPKERLQITFEATGDDERKITFRAQGTKYKKLAGTVK